VREWYVIICNVVEKVEFILVKHQGGCNAVHWGVTPPFIEETAGMIKMVKVVLILL
jgi:adenylosuccinate lyase